MPIWYLLGGLGLAAGLVWLVTREPAAQASTTKTNKDISTNKDVSGSTDAETKKAIEALALLPADLLTKAEDAILSGDPVKMRNVAQELDDAGHGVEAQVLRGRALATRAASAGAILSNCLMFTPPRSPREAIARDVRHDWVDRFAATAYATQGASPDARLVEAGSLHDQAGVLLDGLYVIDGATYFVGDPRTMTGSMMVDYTADVPEGWSIDGAIPGLYLPTADELRALQSAVQTADAKVEIDAVLAGLGEPSLLAGCGPNTAFGRIMAAVSEPLQLEYKPVEYMPLYDNSAFSIGATA